MCAGKDAEHSVDNVGTVPAALATYLACQQYKPDLIISVGTAGGFKAQGASIGDVFVGTTTVNHDRRIPIPVLLRGMLPFKLGRAVFGACHAAFLSFSCCLSELFILPSEVGMPPFIPGSFLLVPPLLLTGHYRLAVSP